MTMIEWLARAMCAEYGGYDWEDEQDRKRDMEDRGPDRQDFMRIARANLRAMRIPSQAMVEAISNGIYDDLGSTTIWEAAIEAALNDDGDPT